MEKHNLIIVITIVLGCLVTFQALKSVEEPDFSESYRNDLQNIPAWILASRFSYSSHPETIIEVDEQEVSKFPLLVEALKKADEVAHPIELINCTNNEAKKIIEFLGGEYLSVRTDYGFDIKLVLRAHGDNYKFYSIFIMFSWERPKMA